MTSCGTSINKTKIIAVLVCICVQYSNFVFKDAPLKNWDPSSEIVFVDPEHVHLFSVCNWQCNLVHRCMQLCFQASCKFEHLLILKVLKWCYLFSSAQKAKKCSRLYLLKYLVVHLRFFLYPPYSSCVIPAENSCEICIKLLCLGISSTAPVHLSSFQQLFL